MIDSKKNAPIVQDFRWLLVIIANKVISMAMIWESARKWRSLLCWLALPFLLSSCATVIIGTKARIWVDGRVEEPVTIVTSAGEYRDVTLPTMVQVKRRHLGGQHISISSEHYAFSDIVLQRNVSVCGALCALFTGWSLIPDLLTNAISDPAQNSFYITPAASQQKADSVHRADSLRQLASEQARRKWRQPPSRLRRHELRGSIGFGSSQADHDTQKLINDYEQRFGVGAGGDCNDFFGASYASAGLEYHYRLNRHWDVGAVVNWGTSREGYSGYEGPYIKENGWESPTYVYLGNELGRAFVVGPSVRYTWRETADSHCYSRLLLGGLRQHLSYSIDMYPFRNDGDEDSVPIYSGSTSKVKWRMAYQVTLAGASFGSEALRFYGELGFGCLGVVRLGMSLHL
jgi:hypothetical protein